ncbi:hypothetical protein [Sulfurimonas sp.]|uniref:hypothetical protein n=1 Tax=Sulfurimonas sp. TaxID=2022749 RepID=UPI003D0BD35D
MIAIFKKPVYYVQIKKNSFIVRSVNSGKTIVFDASTPFSTDRLLIGEFTVAEGLLKKAFSTFGKSLVGPKVVMHPLEMVDEKLSEVEEKILRELAFSVGAKDVKLWLGEELDDSELLQ